MAISTLYRKKKKKKKGYQTPAGYVGVFVRVRESTRDLLRATLEGMRASQDPGEGAADAHSLGALIEQCVIQALAPTPASTSALARPRDRYTLGVAK